MLAHVTAVYLCRFISTSVPMLSICMRACRYTARCMRLSARCLGGHVDVPWSAFNGGKDVWVDIGNKAEGVAMLQGLFQLSPKECLHVGDQFGASGNDLAARYLQETQPSSLFALSFSHSFSQSLSQAIISPSPQLVCLVLLFVL